MSPAQENDEPNQQKLASLAERAGTAFVDGPLMLQALAHRSWCAEVGGEDSNERLEFLGDAVLGLVVTDHLYRRYPELAEGGLAKVRAAVVNTTTLAEVATDLGIGPSLLLGRGEEASGGRQKPSILADAMEAVIGALYLHGGWEAAGPFVLGLFADRIAEAALGPGGHDYKTRLQELTARDFEALPRYAVRHEGPDHARRYFATVTIEEVERGQGEGRSKKEAEQAAAKAAWEELAVSPGPGRA